MNFQNEPLRINKTWKANINSLVKHKRFLGRDVRCDEFGKDDSNPRSRRNINVICARLNESDELLRQT